MSGEKLKIILFYGSTRENRLVERVATFVKNTASEGGLEVTVFDPQELPLTELLKQSLHFYRNPSTDAPAWMLEADEKIRNADGFIIVTPEYNANIPAALSNMIDHFPPWSYRHRPVGLVTYSIGHGGGGRVTVHLRSYTTELGMLPIPTNVIIPGAHSAFEADGTCKVERVENKVKSMVSELHWYAEAMKIQRVKKPLPDFMPDYASLLKEFSS